MEELKNTQETEFEVTEPVEEEVTDLVETDPVFDDYEYPTVTDDEENKSGNVVATAAGLGTGAALLIGGFILLRRKINKYIESNTEPESAGMAAAVAFTKARRAKKALKKAKKEEGKVEHVDGEVIDK